MRLIPKYLIPDINNINQFFKNREEYSRYLLMRARGYLDENKKEKAFQLVDKAVQIAPDAWYAMQYSYYLYSAAGENEKAIGVLG